MNDPHTDLITNQQLKTVQQRHARQAEQASNQNGRNIDRNLHIARDACNLDHIDDGSSDDDIGTKPHDPRHCEPWFDDYIP